MRNGRDGTTRHGARPHAHDCPLAFGKTTCTLVPVPEVLSISMVPSWASTMLLQMARPRPVPTTQQDYEKIALQVISEVQTAHLALQAAEQNIQTARAAITAAEEDYRVTQLRYEAGRGVNVEVLDALAALTPRAQQLRACAV